MILKEENQTQENKKTPFAESVIIYGLPGSGKTTQLKKYLANKTGRGLYISQTSELDASVDYSLDVINSANAGELDRISKSFDKYDFVVVDAYGPDDAFLQKATRLFVSAIHDGKGGAIVINCHGRVYLEVLAIDYHLLWLKRIPKYDSEFFLERQIVLDHAESSLLKLFTEVNTSALSVIDHRIMEHTSVSEDYAGFFYQEKETEEISPIEKKD